MKRARRIGAVVIGVALVLGALASNALGRGYTVRSCRSASGTSLVASDSSGGWTVFNRGLGRDGADMCSSTNPRLEAFVGSVPVGTRLVWEFLPPPGTLISSYRILYSGYARPFNGSNRGLVRAASSSVLVAAAHDGVGSVAPTWLVASGTHDRWVELVAQCDGPAGAPQCPPRVTTAFLNIYESEIGLTDDAPPTSGAPTGSAVESTVWGGEELVAFPASDVGGGVYQSRLYVDGALTRTQTVDTWGGRCVDSVPGHRVFPSPQPCPSSIDAAVGIHASALPAGVHDVTLRISDVAGNERTVFSGRKTIVSPRGVGPGSSPSLRGALNGDNGSDGARLIAHWAGGRRARLAVAYRQHAVVRGRLTDSWRRGIRNARIDIFETVDGVLGQTTRQTAALTRSDGRFAIVLARTRPSRRLILRYRSHLNDTVPAVSRSMRLDVRAGVSLRVSPHRSSQGHSVRLSGRLLGRPLPHSGKVVELQARNLGGRWLTFRTVRSSRAGRFVSHYTFRRRGPALYEMRVRVRSGDDYPYATGASNVVRVRVR